MSRITGLASRPIAAKAAADDRLIVREESLQRRNEFLGRWADLFDQQKRVADAPVVAGRQIDLGGQHIA